VGTIHQASSRGFLGEVEAREDVTVLEVTRQTREAIPSQVVQRVTEALESADEGPGFPV
jgi:nucleoside-triphosphatase THEP1